MGNHEGWGLGLGLVYCVSNVKISLKELKKQHVRKFVLC